MKGNDALDAFENFILMELTAFLGLHEIDMPIQYWRSKTGLEVDFVLNQGKIAIEIKMTAKPHLSEVKGLVAYCEDYSPEYAIVVCQVPRKRILATINHIPIVALPWQEFLDNLWNKNYVSV